MIINAGVHMATDSLDWPAFAFGTLGADFTVLSPPELLDQLRDWSRRFGSGRYWLTRAMVANEQ